MKHTSCCFKKLFFRLAVSAGCLLSFGTGIGTLTSRAEDSSYTRTLIGSWEHDEKGWRFLRNRNPEYPCSQWAEQSDHVYYFNEEGYLVTGWQYIDFHWYYFNPAEGKSQGALMKGWIQPDENEGWYYTNDLGIMVTGWHKIDGYWYYFNPVSDGHMGLMASDQIIDHYYVDSNGRMNELR